MKAIIRARCAVVLACALSPIQIAAAQPAYVGCLPENSTTTAQTLRCEGGVTIVAENGARYILQDRDGNGRVDSAELSSKALLLEVPKRPSAKRFQVTTPQAIAAVRGTKWAVDAVEDKTSVFVVNGRVLFRFEPIQADIVAELVFASSGMIRPFPCAIFLAYNNCAGLAGFGSSFPTVSPSAFLGAWCL